MFRFLHWVSQTFEKLDFPSNKLFVLQVCWCWKNGTILNWLAKGTLLVKNDIFGLFWYQFFLQKNESGQIDSIKTVIAGSHFHSLGTSTLSLNFIYQNCNVGQLWRVKICRLPKAEISILINSKVLKWTILFQQYDFLAQISEMSILAF